MPSRKLTPLRSHYATREKCKQLVAEVAASPVQGIISGNPFLQTALTVLTEAADETTPENEKQPAEENVSQAADMVRMSLDNYLRDQENADEDGEDETQLCACKLFYTTFPRRIRP